MLKAGRKNQTVTVPDFNRVKIRRRIAIDAVVLTKFGGRSHHTVRKLQKAVSSSSTDAEYNALAECVTAVAWLRPLLCGILSHGETRKIVQNDK